MHSEFFSLRYSATAAVGFQIAKTVTLANMMGSLDQFVLVSARKSRGGEWWSPDDYDVRDSHGKVVGRIMLHSQAPKDQPRFWTITAREIPPSVHNHGYSATREQAMADFKARWPDAASNGFDRGRLSPAVSQY